jgi:hypothetical protein
MLETAGRAICRASMGWARIRYRTRYFTMIFWAAWQSAKSSEFGPVQEFFVKKELFNA